MPQVPRAIAKARAAALRAEGDGMLAQRLLSLVGSEQAVLVEKPGLGRTACFAPVELHGNAVAGGIVAARIAGASATHLLAA